MKTTAFVIFAILFFIYSCSAQQIELVKKEIKEENNGLNYRVNVSYSLIKDAVTSSQQNFNKLVEEKIKTEVNNFKKEMETWETYNKEIASEYEFHDTVFYVSDKLISIRFDGFQFYSGAAHPLTFFFTMNYDFKMGKEIDLTDIFSDGYLTVLSDECIKNLKAQKDMYSDDNDDSWLRQGAGPNKENFKIFNFTKTYFLVTFPVYQVASYAEGPREVYLPYTSMMAYIKNGSSLDSFINE